MTPITYTWVGEPIMNIEQWAKDRNEKMVDIVWEVKIMNPYAGTITWHKENDTMPESFLNTLRMEFDRKRLLSHKLREPKL